MAVSSVSSYSPMFNYQDWESIANKRTEELEKRVAELEKQVSSKTDDTSSTSSSSSSSSSNSASSVSTSSFLLNYKQKLTDLESASAKLQVGTKDNVYSKYESALEALSKADTEDAKKAAQEKVDKAREDIVSAVSDFADKYNSTISFLQSNSNRGAGVARQQASLERALPTEGALKTLGMKVNTTGKLEVDEDALNKALTDGRYNSVKETMGGQYGIAQRMGSRATNILDSSIDTVAGSSSTSSTSSTSTSSNTSKANSSVSDLFSSSNEDSMSAYFTSFASFAKSGAYNLSNYYAVGMLLNTLV
ncbi:MAG: flagellar filament capping protein FliD [Ruminococcus sp.]|nr:flagellar filament capping protein FliD [Ruminococcus sp.]